MQSNHEPDGVDYGLLDGIDYDSQLLAIRSLLSRQMHEDQQLEEKIEEAEKIALRTQGAANEHATEQWVGLAHDSCYQEAAHSMAAVGMLAPFLESVFKQAFSRIGMDLTQGHLAENIIKFVEEAGMKSYMPDDLDLCLSALFTYRNKMFHNGFEWPPKELLKFEKRLNNSGWPSEWFSKATIDDDPWMFYMSSAFIEHCVERIEQVTEGIEKFDLDRLTQALE